MREETAEQILDVLFSFVEDLETQSAAILQFLKDKGIASDEELVPHFEQAGKASSVKWRAARVRMNYLLASAAKPPEKVAERESPTDEKKSSEASVDTGTETVRPKDEKDAPGVPTISKDAKAEEDVAASTEKNQNEEGKGSVDRDKNGDGKS
jgi:hypothetical protein